MIYLRMCYMKCILNSKICAGGDQLTAERARGSQRISDNSKTGVERLEGLTPVVEDWHAKMCLLEVSCNRIHMHANHGHISYHNYDVFRSFGSDYTAAHQPMMEAHCFS